MILFYSMHLGLDICKYLSQISSKIHKHHLTCIKVFSSNPEKWSMASPMKYCKNIRIPHLFLIGERTDSLIQIQNRDLLGILTASQQAPAEFYEIPVQIIQQYLSIYYLVEVKSTILF
ncbi:unnamed protein product [Rotaria magnacalcarata]|nr:unnamed protein product [Rotaria magnacalcarata]